MKFGYNVFDNAMKRFTKHNFLKWLPWASASIQTLATELENAGKNVLLQRKKTVISLI